MWNYLFNPFRSKKTGNDGTPSRLPQDISAASHSSVVAKPNPIQISPPHRANDNVHARQSFNSNDTHESKPKHPPSTKITFLLVPDMVSIYNTTQMNKKPKSRKKRSSERLTITASRTNTKTFEWHDKDGFPTQKIFPSQLHSA